MQSRILVALFSAMILLSGFLPFAVLPPIDAPQTPFGRILAVPGLIGSDPAPFLGLPLLAQVFIAGFVAAFLTCLFALLGWAPRLLALVTALLPLSVLLYAWFGGRELVESLGTKLPSGPMTETLSRLSQMAGWGFWLWLIGAILLLMTALLDDGIED